jgi:exosortase A-associated hydrolase 1
MAPDHMERAVIIECEREALVGIVHEPPSPADLGVVVIVGGPQYRVGSHRQFVLLARALADAGFAVLRFDYRGMGDSGGARRDFEVVQADIREAIDALQHQVPVVRRVALWGLCDGASAALLYLGESGDDRVTALCLVNPWARSEESLARTHVKHYYLQRVRQREFWAKLLRGGVGKAAISGLMHNLGLQGNASRPPAERPSFQSRMAAAWRAFDGEVMLALSGSDLTAMEFLEFTARSADWRGLLDRPRSRRVELTGADHTLSASEARASLEMAMKDWLRSLEAPRAPSHTEGLLKALG